MEPSVAAGFDVHTLNWVDYLILAIISFSAMVGLTRGFVREAVSLIAWILAFTLGFYIAGFPEHWLSSLVTTPGYQVAIFGFCFVVIFVLIIYGGGRLGAWLKKQIKEKGLTTTDRLFGFVFGIARGILIVALLLLLCSATGMPHTPAWTGSMLIPVFIPLLDLFRGLMPDDVTNIINNNTTILECVFPT